MRQFSSNPLPQELAKFQIGTSAEEKQEPKTLRLGQGDTKSLNHKRNVSHSSSDLYSQALDIESWSLPGTARDSMASIAQCGVSLVTDKTITTLGSSQTLAQNSERKVSYELSVDTTRSTEQESSGSDKYTDPNHDETNQALESMGNHDEIHTALKQESTDTLSNPPENDISSKIQCQGAGLTIISPSTVTIISSIYRKRGSQEPIKFKDAVGRKFSFPFAACRTWAVRWG
jgi:hypothetical protein